MSKLIFYTKIVPDVCDVIGHLTSKYLIIFNEFKWT